MRSRSLRRRTLRKSMQQHKGGDASNDPEERKTGAYLPARAAAHHLEMICGSRREHIENQNGAV